MDIRQTSAQRGYNNKWRKASKTWLRTHPLCVLHEQLGQIVSATLVDHIVPHRGDQELFWDKANWQGLCKTCHDSVKQRIERTGEYGCDANGIPNDSKHFWNK